MKRAVLSAGEREEQLKHCPGWKYGDGCISRTFKFVSYLDGVAFVNVLAELAEEANHHPDIALGYRRVVVTLTTHDTGGVSLLDIEMAQRIDQRA